MLKSTWYNKVQALFLTFRNRILHEKGLRFALAGTVLTAAITTLTPSSDDYKPRIKANREQQERLRTCIP